MMLFDGEIYHFDAVRSEKSVKCSIKRLTQPQKTRWVSFQPCAPSMARVA